MNATHLTIYWISPIVRPAVRYLQIRMMREQNILDGTAPALSDLESCLVLVSGSWAESPSVRRRHVVCTESSHDECWGSAMRLGTVVFSVTFLLGHASASLAGPLDLTGLKQLSSEHSTDNLRYLTDDFTGLGVFDNRDDVLLVTNSNFDAVSISEPQSRRDARNFQFSMSPITPLANGADSPSPSNSNNVKPKWTAKHGCDGGPCRTVVPEPATAMLLVVGLGLAGVTARLRRMW